MSHCVGVRLARGAPQRLASFEHYSDSVIWHWNVKDGPQREGYVQTDPRHPVLLTQIDDNVDHARMIQFLLATKEEANEMAKQHPHVPLLGGRRKKTKNKRIRKRLAMQRQEGIFEPEQLKRQEAEQDQGRPARPVSQSSASASSQSTAPEPTSPGSQKRPR